MTDKDIHNTIPSPDIFVTLTAEEQKAVAALDSPKEFKKGTVLLREGMTPTQSFFVAEGLVRKYRIDGDEERTIEFYTDQESVFALTGSNNPSPSTFTLECLEDSKISVVTFEQEREMYKRFPRFERLCRLTTERDLQAYQEQFANYLSWSPEQRYLNLLDTRPDLIGRVPQYQLASYLGVKPESLSRIRKRISKR